MRATYKSYHLCTFPITICMYEQYVNRLLNKKHGTAMLLI